MLAVFDSLRRAALELSCAASYNLQVLLLHHPLFPVFLGLIDRQSELRRSQAPTDNGSHLRVNNCYHLSVLWHSPGRSMVTAVSKGFMSCRALDAVLQLGGDDTSWRT